MSKSADNKLSDALPVLRNPLLGELLENLAKKRLGGSPIVNELVGFSRSMDSAVFDVMEDILSMSETELAEYIQANSLGKEDADLFVRWNLRYHLLAPSFAEMRKILGGRVNSWRRSDARIISSPRGPAYFELRLFDNEGTRLFDYQDHVLSALTLASSIINTITSDAVFVVEHLKPELIGDFSGLLRDVENSIRKGQEAIAKTQASAASVSQDQVN